MRSSTGISEIAPPTTYAPLGLYAATFLRSVSVWLGIVLILVGCASLAGGTLVTKYINKQGYLFSEYANGFWGGAIFVAAGSVSITAGHYKTDRLIIATTVLSVVTMAVGCAQVALAAIRLKHLYPPQDFYMIKVSHELLIGAGASAIIIGFGLLVACFNTFSDAQSNQVVPLKPLSEMDLTDQISIVDLERAPI